MPGNQHGCQDYDSDHLSQLVTEAVRQYLAARAPRADEPPFELLVRGRPGGRFPTPGELEDLELAEDIGAIALPKPRVRRRAAP